MTTVCHHYILLSKLSSLPTLTFTQNISLLFEVLEETLRLFPPVDGVSRALSEDTVLGGYKLPKDTIILVRVGCVCVCVCVRVCLHVYV